MKKHPSLLKACRITTQKLLYFLVFVASLLRGTYFAAPVSLKIHFKPNAFIHQVNTQTTNIDPTMHYSIIMISLKIL
jgi:hypothetical protein